MANTLNKTGITTGNTVEAYHVTQSIDAFTGTEAYDITLSGSLTVTGSVSINGLSDTAQTNVLTIDTTTGQLYYTSSTDVNPIDTGSFVTTASVNLNTITFTQGDGSTFPITVDTGSGGGGGGGITPAETGSFIVTASATNNVITFTQGDGSTFPVTVDTGSSATFDPFGGVTIVEVTTQLYTIPNSGSYRIFQNHTATSKCDITMPVTASLGDVIEIIEIQGNSDTDINLNGTAGTGQIIKMGDRTTTQGSAGFVRTQQAPGGDGNTYLKLICTNSGTSTSVGQVWKIVEVTSDNIFDYNTTGTDPTDTIQIS